MKQSTAVLEEQRHVELLAAIVLTGYVVRGMRRSDADVEAGPKFAGARMAVDCARDIIKQNRGVQP